MISNITSPETIARWLDTLYENKLEISQKRGGVVVYKNDFSPTDILDDNVETPTYSERDKITVTVTESPDRNFDIRGEWEDVDINIQCDNTIEELVATLPIKTDKDITEVEKKENGFPREKEPLEINSIGDRFGILIPDSSLRIRKQTGGMACTQVYLDGTYIPLTEPLLHQGSPDWTPDSNGTEKPPISNIQINTQPKREYVADKQNTLTNREYQTLPEWIKDRGGFFNYNQFYEWYSSPEAWMHGTINLIDELRQYNYSPNGNLMDRDMSEKWESREEIWQHIADKLPFEYDECDREQIIEDDDIDNRIYPPRKEGIKWICIRGSKEYRGEPKAEWANELEGDKVMLLYPNCD